MMNWCKKWRYFTPNSGQVQLQANSGQPDRKHNAKPKHNSKRKQLWQLSEKKKITASARLMKTGHIGIYIHPARKHRWYSEPRTTMCLQWMYMFRGRIPDIPDSWPVADSFVLPVAYCPIKFAKAMFRDAHHYFSMLCRNLESYIWLQVFQWPAPSCHRSYTVWSRYIVSIETIVRHRTVNLQRIFCDNEKMFIFTGGHWSGECEKSLNDN